MLALKLSTAAVSYALFTHTSWFDPRNTRSLIELKVRYIFQLVPFMYAPTAMGLLLCKLTA